MKERLNILLATTMMISLIMVLVTASASAQECGEYEVTVIAGPDCPPFGLTSVIPQAISETGDVVGYTSCNFFQQAFLWTPEDGLQLIPMPDGTSKSQALAISGSKIVGFNDITGDEFGRQGFLFDYQTDEFTSLGTVEGGDSSEAHAINSKGEIVGFWQNSQVGPRHGFIYKDGNMKSLGDDIGTPNSQANDINVNGLVTGLMGTSFLTDARAFIWNEGDVTELPTIPGGITSEGNAINNLGDVAGHGRFFDPKFNAIARRAFAFIDGEAINLGTLPGHQNSIATGINDDKIIVGTLFTPGGPAFVWRNGKMTALNDLILPSENLFLETARGINQTGQIVVKAYSSELSATIGVLLTPILGPLGDLNNDCQITTVDLQLLLDNWGVCNDCPADLDGNGIVSVRDLLILFSNWG